MSEEMPEPKRGGTFLYCQWHQKIPHGMTSCLGRFRTAKAYRRHWRKQHAEATQ